MCQPLPGKRCVGDLTKSLDVCKAQIKNLEDKHTPEELENNKRYHKALEREKELERDMYVSSTTEVERINHRNQLRQEQKELKQNGGNIEQIEEIRQKIAFSWSAGLEARVRDKVTEIQRTPVSVNIENIKEELPNLEELSTKDRVILLGETLNESKIVNELHLAKMSELENQIKDYMKQPLSYQKENAPILKHSIPTQVSESLQRRTLTNGKISLIETSTFTQKPPQDYNDPYRLQKPGIPFEVADEYAKSNSDCAHASNIYEKSKSMYGVNSNYTQNAKAKLLEAQKTNLIIRSVYDHYHQRFIEDNE